MVTEHSERHGAHHRRLRREWKVKVEAGRVNCARCGRRIVPDRAMTGDGWELDHDPIAGGPRDYNGPVHMSCNHGGRPPAHPNGCSCCTAPTPSTDWTQTEGDDE